MKEKFQCVENPDCFNCPYPDCRATIKDLNRQNAYENKCLEKERNKKIIELYTNDNIKIKNIADVMCVSTFTVMKVLKEGGVYDRT